MTNELEGHRVAFMVANEGMEDVEFTEPLETDIRNAGGTWIDAEVQVCTEEPNGLITSRKPDDLPAFCKQLVSEFQRQPHPA